MRDGLYKVHFQTQFGAGAGVIHLAQGSVRGGDAGHYYIGTYRADDENFFARVDVNRHSSGVPSVLGIDQATIILDGPVSGDVLNCCGTAPAAPGVTFQATLTRIAD